MSEVTRKWIWMMDWCKRNGHPPSNHYFWEQAEDAHKKAAEKRK